MDTCGRAGCVVDDAEQTCVSVFFFQAEDGIRDLTVTGVQTCALPISDSDCTILCSTRRGLGQSLSAMRAILPSRVNGLTAFRARWLQQSTAVRTEWKSCLFDMPAAGARLRQRVAENEVQDHPNRIRNEDRQQRPHYVPHLPPLRVA